MNTEYSDDCWDRGFCFVAVFGPLVQFSVLQRADIFNFQETKKNNNQ